MATRQTLPPSADSEQAYRMINVEEKAPTRRRAVASGQMHAAPETIDLIKRGKVPKGDVLALAEVAGIMAAKRTSETLPLCHPLPLDSVRVWCEVKSDSIVICCEVIATAKTGVEMEALNGVSAALLCAYDLTKAIDPVLSISAIHLKVKEGGKSGVWIHPMHGGHAVELQSAHERDGAWKGLRIGVLTVSDRCSKNETVDRSGPLMARLAEELGAKVTRSSIVPDEIGAIGAAIERMVSEDHSDLVLCTGGTGIGPRDVTPEAVFALGATSIPGVGELLRSSGAKHTPMSWLSRGEAALLNGRIILMLPGSASAVEQGVRAVADVLPHAVEIARGGAHG